MLRRAFPNAEVNYWRKGMIFDQSKVDNCDMYVYLPVGENVPPSDRWSGRPPSGVRKNILRARAKNIPVYLLYKAQQGYSLYETRISHAAKTVTGVTNYSIENAIRVERLAAQNGPIQQKPTTVKTGRYPLGSIFVKTKHSDYFFDEGDRLVLVHDDNTDTLSFVIEGSNGHEKFLENPDSFAFTAEWQAFAHWEDLDCVRFVESPDMVQPTDFVTTSSQIEEELLLL